MRIAQDDVAGAETFCRQLDKAAAEYASHLWVAMARQSRGELAAAQGNLDEALTPMPRRWQGSDPPETTMKLPTAWLLLLPSD